MTVFVQAQSVCLKQHSLKIDNSAFLFPFLLQECVSIKCVGKILCKTPKW